MGMTEGLLVTLQQRDCAEVHPTGCRNTCSGKTRLDVHMIAYLGHNSTHEDGDIVRVCPKYSVDSCLKADAFQMQPSLLKNLALCTVLPGLAKLKVSTR